MCGIVGFTHRKRRMSPERIERALELLSHRGPDRQAAFESHLISLGATRLKILDLEAGNQPMTSRDGDTVIAFNGEIYNHLELRPELERLGFEFHSHTDTETVLNAFLAWDVECFAKMRGMFAVALWTESRNRLVLARDRMGIKPLYFTHQGNELYFASELKAILVHPEIERNLSLAALDSYLSLNYSAGSQTLIEGIEKLRPGYWLEWQGGRLRSESYWSLPFGPQHVRSLDAAKEELDGLLKQSVREHLLSDVPLGVWLSGGVDSSTILHYASEASSRPLRSFSISFRGRSFDESRYIRKAAEQYNTDHYELDLNPEADLQAAIEEFAYYSDEPNADAGALPVWFLSKLTRRHATVALSGEGADELFGGYLTYRADSLARLARYTPAFARRFALSAMRHLPVSDEKISFEYKVKRFLEGSLLPEARAHVFWNGTFTDEAKQALLRMPLPSALAQLLPAPGLAGDPLTGHLWFDQSYYLPDDILAKVDRMSMAHSIEVRPPFLDHRIVEFAASLPPHLKIDGARQKVVLKNLMAGKIPPSIVRRRKVGFDIPAHEWLRGPLRALLIETMATAGSEFGELFDQAQIDQLLQLHLTRRANLGYHLWGLMILFLWMRKWRIQLPGSSRIERQLVKSASGSI
ncbi:MAG TPA: asparagine synthase (glutamine-hydrolyzing) [Bryobacteraceae bacterium]|nr:asparagine synthase (glutamine-hydrolyzing) [Bryobacteraceae bacterium]